MKIAIVGGGFAGTALAYFLQDEEVSLFEQGTGASHIAAGLLHTRPGKDRRLSERGEEGMKATEELLEVAGWPVAEGIIRDGVLVEGYTVFCATYLKRLKEQIKLSTHQENFDRVIYCLGYGVQELGYDLPLRFVKGQVLRCRLNIPLPHSIIGDGYVAISEQAGECFVGSTYEHNFTSVEKDIQEAKRLILPRTHTFFPSISEEDVIDCASGVRVVNRHHYRPLVQEVEPGIYVMTAMGSRGLLYHALYAKELAHEIYLSRHRGLDGHPRRRLPLSGLSVGPSL
ncbi:MAG: FAD-dependent oxidoreductase [Simkaniaceae bacterium]|nr:FAD-dependent oxidoreductase [Simkaniaceae bacterium]